MGADRRCGRSFRVLRQIFTAVFRQFVPAQECGKKPQQSAGPSTASLARSIQSATRSSASRSRSQTSRVSGVPGPSPRGISPNRARLPRGPNRRRSSGPCPPSRHFCSSDHRRSFAFDPGDFGDGVPRRPGEAGKRDGRRFLGDRLQASEAQWIISAWSKCYPPAHDRGSAVTCHEDRQRWKPVLCRCAVFACA